jgi:hypothetical protein
MGSLRFRGTGLASRVATEGEQTREPGRIPNVGGAYSAGGLAAEPLVPILLILRRSLNSMAIL